MPTVPCAEFAMEMYQEIVILAVRLILESGRSMQWPIDGGILYKSSRWQSPINDHRYDTIE